MPTCPSCGQPAAGKFCTNCGNAIRGSACPACGTGLTAGERFCHQCGASVSGSAFSRPMVPWIVAGAAVVLLVLVVIVRFTGTSPATDAANPAAATPATGGMVDLSQLTPREAADRLFNRIMTAHEEGSMDQVRFFLPMATQSYQSLGELDADARYHLGLIQAVAGEVEAALSQADSLERSAPNHLFVAVLRATASGLSGDSAALRRAYGGFLDHYEEEIASGKLEYDEHRRAIEQFREQASQFSARR